MTEILKLLSFDVIMKIFEKMMPGPRGMRILLNYEAGRRIFP